MSNKRQLKKHITCVCGELAAEILTAYHTYESINRENVEDIINDIFSLQATTLSHITFAYDKTRAEFADGAAYNKAKHEYNHKAFAQLYADFNAGVTDIVKKMNAALPTEVREANKAAK